MTIERVVQPLVACIGNPVAGNPSQFVMSRIAKDAQLDWRFFTSQVEFDRFEAAILGMKALGFRGASMLSPYQTQIIEYLDEISPAAAALNQVTAVRGDEGKWIGENNLGLALWNAIAPHVLSHSDAMQPRHFVVVENKTFADVLKLELEKLSFESTLWNIGSPTTQESLETDTSAPSPKVVDRAGTIQELIESQAKVSAIICAQPSDLLRPRDLLNLNWEKPGILFFCYGKLDKVAQSLKTAARELELVIMDEVDMLAHLAACDFHFWTGYQPDVNEIRESLEEYLQW